VGKPFVVMILKYLSEGNEVQSKSTRICGGKKTPLLQERLIYGKTIPALGRAI
jgi:hypothetical protein